MGGKRKRIWEGKNKRPEGHHDDKNETKKKRLREGVVMLRWRCITSAGDITMSAVSNMRDDIFMCEAIKSNEAGQEGIGKIHSLFPSNFPPPTSSLSHHMCVILYRNCSTHISSKYYRLSFHNLAKNTLV